MNQAFVVRLCERAERLQQEVDDTSRGLRSLLLDEALQIQAVEELHYEVERSIVRGAVVEHFDRAPRLERREGLRFPTKALLGDPCIRVRRGPLEPTELHGCRARHEARHGPPELPDPARAEEPARALAP